jgi:hypothetical protein
VAQGISPQFKAQHHKKTKMKKTLVQEDKDVSEMNYQQDAPTFQFNR